MPVMPLRNNMHILFVCWGNICRSPAAEATFRKLVEDQGLSEKITIDSAGTISSHQGNPPDSRMRSAANSRNLVIAGSARKVNSEDFRQADMLITMDHFNFSELSKLSPSAEQAKKIIPFCNFVSTEDSEVPDPYYGGPSGFEKVLDLLEDGCVNLLEEVKNKLK
jgi:protein-tyrosine phosphatase